MSRHHLNVRLSKKDQDIKDWLDHQSNGSLAVRTLIRRAIKIYGQDQDYIKYLLVNSNLDIAGNKNAGNFHTDNHMQSKDQPKSENHFKPVAKKKKIASEKEQSEKKQNLVSKDKSKTDDQKIDVHNKSDDASFWLNQTTDFTQL